MGLDSDQRQPYPMRLEESKLSEPRLVKLGQKTEYLYAQPFSVVIHKALITLVHHPLTGIKTLGCLCKDTVKLLFQRSFSPKKTQHFLEAFGLVLHIAYRFIHGAALARELKARQIEHLHIHFIDAPTDIGMYASLVSGIPFSVTAHANDIFTRNWLLSEKGTRAQAIATISDFNVTRLSDQGVPRSKLSIVRCGVDSNAFTPRAFKNKSDTVRFGFLGRLIEKKGLHILLDALSKLHQQQVPFLLECVGDGPWKTQLLQQCVGNEPAITKNIQKVVVNTEFVLHDTPGILWPKIINPHSGYRLAIIGAIKNTAIDFEDIACYAIETLTQHYPAQLIERYQLSELPSIAYDCLTEIGAKRGAKQAGGRINQHKAAEILIHDLRNRIFGPITLETPTMIENELSLIPTPPTNHANLITK